MGLELTIDRYPPITSQMRYPLRHAASAKGYIMKLVFTTQFMSLWVCEFSRFYCIYKTGLHLIEYGRFLSAAIFNNMLYNFAFTLLSDDLKITLFTF